MTTTLYVGAVEIVIAATTRITTTYYEAGAAPMAMRVVTGTVYYLHTDHLGSTTLTTEATGQTVARQSYYAYGAPRHASGGLPTDKTFTGQRADSASLGRLMDFNARFYSPELNRWLQPDTIVPSPSDPQDLNRYSYTRNNPLKYTDPTGHDPKNDYGESMNDNCNYAGVDCPDSSSIGKIARYYRRYFPKAWKNRGEWQFGAEPRDFQAGRATAIQLGVEWLTGTGPRDRDFGPGDPLTTELKNYDHNTNEILPKVAADLENGIYEGGDAGDSLEGVQGVPKFINNYAASMTLGENGGNIAAAYLGSYSGKYTVLQVDAAEGVAIVQFDITNSSTAVSGFRPPLIGYTEFWRNTVGPAFNGAVAWLLPGQMMGRTTQYIQWTYAVEFGR